MLVGQVSISCEIERFEETLGSHVKLVTSRRGEVFVSAGNL